MSGKMPMHYDATPDLLNADLILAFFWRFSVFEFALKREGFLKQGAHDAAIPDWKKFADSIRGQFAKVRNAGFQEAVRELTDYSPRRQVVRDDKLVWEDIKRDPDQSHEEFVLRLVRTARNNLFHGGKYPSGPIEEVARNRAILLAALKVLEGCYELHSGIARWMQAAHNQQTHHDDGPKSRIRNVG